MTQGVMKFREKLQQGQVCFGAGVGFSDPLVAEALADSCDFIFVDLEHSGLSHQTAMLHFMAARGKQVAPFVRVQSTSDAFIKPALDSGAEGIIAPQVKTVEQVRQFVNACRYPPLGNRGFGPRVPSNFGRVGGPAFFKQQDEAIFVAVQIETREALECLDEILAIEQLDSVFIGPYDLSGAMGVLGQLDDPTLNKAIDVVIEKTRAAGKYVGAGMRTDPDYAMSMARRGVQWMQVGSDFGFMVRGMDNITKSVREKLKGDG